MSDFAYTDILANLLRGALWTVAMSILSFVGGALLGLLVLAVRVSPSIIARRCTAVLIALVQGVPLLMLMFLAFFGLALFGWDVPAWLAASGALVLWSGAYFADIWRGCVESIPRGQWESSATLAMNYAQQMRHVILPQAIRIAVPPTVGFCVQIVKGTSLTSVIGFVELSKSSSMIANATLEPLPVFASAALIYFVICFLLSTFSRYLERTLDVAHRH